MRRLIGDRVELLFVFNHSTTPGDATISLRLPWPAREALDLVTDRLVGLGQRDGKTALHRSLAAGEILVVRLERR